MGSSVDFRKRVETKNTSTWSDYKVIEYCNALTAPHKLLYVCKSGSRLHGTETPESDSDYKGIFLPMKDSCLLGETPNLFRYQSGDDDTKNSKDDVDIELWSIQEWIKLMSDGDSNALSVLFSTFNMEHVIFADPLMEGVVENYQFLYNPNKVEGFVGFASSQSMKYGIKGSRLTVLLNILVYLEDRRELGETTTLGDLDLADLIEECQSQDSKGDDYISLNARSNGDLFLTVAKKEHQSTILLDTFKERITNEYEKYGKRSHTAAQMGCNDWKSLSHSLRALYEAHELLTTGKVIYPLSSAILLKTVKLGYLTIEEFKIIYSEIEDVVKSLLDGDKITSYYDRGKSNEIILNLYSKEE